MVAADSLGLQRPTLVLLHVLHLPGAGAPARQTLFRNMLVASVLDCSGPRRLLTLQRVSPAAAAWPLPTPFPGAMTPLLASLQSASEPPTANIPGQPSDPALPFYAAGWVVIKQPLTRLSLGSGL